jgi:hypothetical protein
MKRRYNDGGEIKKKIADLQKLIKNPKTDANFIPLYQKCIDKLQAKLQTIEPQEVEVEIKTPKPRVEKTEKRWKNRIDWAIGATRKRSQGFGDYSSSATALNNRELFLEP